MLYRTFGKTKERISNLGFGCMRLPVVDGQDDTIDEPIATQMLRYAIDQGFNYIDTANPYHKGMSELFIDRALNNGYCDKVFLATKLPSWEVQTPEDCERSIQRFYGGFKVNQEDMVI